MATHNLQESAVKGPEMDTIKLYNILCFLHERLHIIPSGSPLAIYKSRMRDPEEKQQGPTLNPGGGGGSCWVIVWKEEPLSGTVMIRITLP